MSKNPTHLLSLASRQIWPHVLVAAHLKPERLTLLHTSDATESHKPALRLQHFFRQSGGPVTDLKEIPGDDFIAIRNQIGEIARDGNMSADSTVLHFTGGNKLMATAAYEWAKENSYPACYLERGNVLYQFIPETQGYLINSARLDIGMIRDADPLLLLSAQLGEAVLQNGGETLRLNSKGTALPTEKLAEHLRKGDIHGGFQFRSLVEVANPSKKPVTAGDNLEYAAAVVILKQGVPVVQRGVELKSSVDAKVVESEIDLVFQWNGRLWMADCKAKSSGATKLRKLENEMRRLGWDISKIKPHLDKLKGQLADTEARLIKEDLQQISEIGGLLGSAFAVRLQGLPEDVMRFALTRRPKVEVIHVANMVNRISQLLRLI
jgi:hypothetical protein